VLKDARFIASCFAMALALSSAAWKEFRERGGLQAAICPRIKPSTQEHGRSNQDERALERLLDKLPNRVVTGDSFGGPYVGVGHNDVTKAIVAYGQKAVPHLLDRLQTSNVDETIFIVFCLRELRATAAREAVDKLRQDLKRAKRFAGVQRDFTLEVQIDYFLANVDSWK